MEKSFKLKISIYYSLIIFLLPSFLSYRKDLSTLYTLWHYAQLLLMLYLLVRYIFVDKYDSRIVNLILIFYVAESISCIVNGQSPVSILWEMVPDIGISIYAYKALKKNTKVFVSSAANIFFTYNCINLITMLVFPDGIASGRIGQVNYFLGGKNIILPWIIVGGGLYILDAHYQSGKHGTTTKLILKLAVSSIAAFIAESSTTLIAVIFLFFFVILDFVIRNKDFLKRFFSGRKLILVVAALFIMIVVMSGSGSGSVFTAISDYLGRDTTFNGRTALWLLAISYIKAHPLFGIGPNMVLDVGWGVTMTHAHCLYLNVCAKYGIIAIAILILIIWYAFRQKNDLPWIVYVCLGIYLLCSIVEVYSTYYLFFLCVLLAHTEKLINEESTHIA